MTFDLVARDPLKGTILVGSNNNPTGKLAIVNFTAGGKNNFFFFFLANL
jgi:hypothetical protein